MSEVPVSGLEAWLRKTMSPEISQAERERDRLLLDIAHALDVLQQNCAQLSKKAEQDMEMKRDNRAQYRAARAVARLTAIITDMCQAFGTGSSKDSASLRNLQRETARFSTDAARRREEWIRQIRPYHILDMMTLGGNIDKVKRLAEELHNHLMGRGVLLHSLEDLHEKVISLGDLRAARDAKVALKESLEQRLSQADRTEQELRAHVNEIRENPKMKEYVTIDEELRKLRGDLLTTGFSRLGRPLKKLISISERGDYPLPPDVRESVREYVRKPFTTFLSEEDGYPRLKAVITALSKAVSSGKLALKQREAKKVMERSEQVVAAESLSTIHKKAKSLKQTHDSILIDSETAELVNRLRELRQKGRANRSLQRQLKTELQKAIDSDRHLEDQIRNAVEETEAFVRKMCKTTVRLQLA
jgi:hypothetical protein